MKRTLTAAVAAATALTLVTTPAFAQENEQNQGSSQQQNADKKKLSEVTDEQAIDYAKKQADKANGLVKPALEKTGEEQEKALKPLVSSLKSDAAQGWEPGKTAAILIGTLVPAAILGLLAFAANSGLVPGFQLPALPF